MDNRKQLGHDDLINIIAMLTRQLGGCAVIQKDDCRGQYDLDVNFTDDEIIVSYRPVLAVVRMPTKAGA